MYNFYNDRNTGYQYIPIIKNIQDLHLTQKLMNIKQKWKVLNINVIILKISDQY